MDTDMRIVMLIVIMPIATLEACEVIVIHMRTFVRGLPMQCRAVGAIEIVVTLLIRTRTRIQIYKRIHSNQHWEKARARARASILAYWMCVTLRSLGSQGQKEKQIKTDVGPGSADLK